VIKSAQPMKSANATNLTPSLESLGYRTRAKAAPSQSGTAMPAWS
jgi:hypothetical protein